MKLWEIGVTGKSDMPVAKQPKWSATSITIRNISTISTIMFICILLLILFLFLFSLLLLLLFQTSLLLLHFNSKPSDLTAGRSARRVIMVWGFMVVGKYEI